MKLQSAVMVALLSLLPMVASAVIKTEAIDYKDGETALQGFVVYDDSITDKRPGVLVYPEWWGLTDYPKHRAEMLAKLGYVAFCADMYGKGVTTDDPKKAGAMMTPIKEDRGMMRRRAKLAIDAFKTTDKADNEKLAAIGYCFGGTCVLELARDGAPLKGVVSFHGGLDAKEPAQAPVKPKILVLAGGDDSFVPTEQVLGFLEEMRNAKANWQLNVYHDAKHAFTNPDADKFGIDGIAYNKQADNRSWAAMRAFLTECLGKVTPPAAK